MVEVVKEGQKETVSESKITRKSSLIDLRLAEKQNPGKLRELFSKKLVSKDNVTVPEPLNAKDKLKEGDRLYFDFNIKENRDAYFNVRLKELLPSYVKQIRVKQHGRGEDGIANFNNGEYRFNNSFRAEVFKTEVTIISVDHGKNGQTEISKENLTKLAETEEGRIRLRAYALSANGKFLLHQDDPLYNVFKIHFLYRGPQDKFIYINNKKAIWDNGKEGWTYYLESDKEKQHRAYIYSGDIVAKDLPITIGNLNKIAQTENGRARLREIALEKNGRVIISTKNPIYNSFKIHHLFRGEAIWINGRKAVYTEGSEGETYYYASDKNKSSRVLFFTGDIIKSSEEKLKVATIQKRAPKIQKEPSSPESEKEIKEVTSRNLDKIAGTERGRARLRKLAITNNVVTISDKTPFYNSFKIHHLFKDIPIWINGKKALFANGADGKTYYYENDKKRKNRVYFFTGDIITTEKPDEKLLSEKLDITPDNISFIAKTEEGRERLRKYCINDKGLFTIKSSNPIYNYLKLHHLFRDRVIWKNNQKCVLKNTLYYFANTPNKQVTFYTNDYISNIERRNSLGFTSTEEQRLARYTNYADFYQKQEISAHNRTLKNRFEDHALLLDAIINNPNTPELKRVRSILFPTKNHKPFFIDIGPGLADIDNTDFYKKGGQGVPAVTTAEIAQKFPNMPVMALDLPRAVDIFLGRKKSLDRYQKPYTVNDDVRNRLLQHNNVHIVAGDGLLSLRDQLESPKTNPIPNKERPKISSNTTLIIRAANSIDIYCKWYEKNGSSPSVREALARMGSDFKDNPVMLLFSKEIMVKPAGSTQWTIIGTTSEMGFSHVYRKELSREGKPPFTINKDSLENV